MIAAARDGRQVYAAESKMRNINESPPSRLMLFHAVIPVSPLPSTPLLPHSPLCALRVGQNAHDLFFHFAHAPRLDYRQASRPIIDQSGAVHCLWYWWSLYFSAGRPHRRHKNGSCAKINRSNDVLEHRRLQLEPLRGRA